MYAGAILSAAGHAALIALALAGPPWLSPPPPRPVHAVRVSLVDAATLAAAARVARDRPAPPTVPERPPERAPAPARAERPPREAAAAPATDTLAPRFDPAAPLAPVAPSRGSAVPLQPPSEPRARIAPKIIQVPTRVAPPLEVRSRPRSRPPLASAPPPGAGVAGAGARNATLRERYRSAVHAAIVRAQVAAPDGGMAGATELRILVGRDGRLREARVLRSSGSAAADRASLDAARDAVLPIPPPDLGPADLTFEVTVQLGRARE